MSSSRSLPEASAGAGSGDGRPIAVAVAELAKSYGTPAAPVHALRAVSLEVMRGERIALLGKSGSGKSTLLNLLGGLDRPTSGSIRVGASDLARMSSDELARYRLTTVGMIFQAYNLIPSRTALENVELPMVFAGKPVRERRESAKKALDAVGLGHRLGHRPNELSGGEHQRVAIARAIVNDPRILLADEPTGNLDSSTALEVMELLMTHLRTHGTTMIMVTHDEELAARCADRIVRLKDGQLLS
jgi:predicted ABC-type transport system involved in lysophospholipase L1 biosynthesis ATPase subunit